jgi:hypothetical protein
MGAGESVPGMSDIDVETLQRRWSPAVLNKVRADGLALFKSIDKDKSGTLDRGEFAQLMGALGFGGDNADEEGVSPLANLLFNTVNRDGTGEITRYEFANWLLTIRYGSANQKIR